MCSVSSSPRCQCEGVIPGVEHFYDPDSHCRVLETKLRNLRWNLEQGQRRYKKRKATRDCSGIKNSDTMEDGHASNTDEWVTLIKRLRPSAENLSAIKSGMEKTYTRCRGWITKDSPTVEEILNKYPRFLDMPSLVGCLVPWFPILFSNAPLK
ncbi:hypothetical protein ABVT39_022571 [Epinephelus coioides]